MVNGGISCVNNLFAGLYTKPAKRCSNFFIKVFGFFAGKKLSILFWGITPANTADLTAKKEKRAGF